MFCRARRIYSASPWQRLRSNHCGRGFASTKGPSSRSKISGDGENRPSGAAGSSVDESSSWPKQNSVSTRKLVRHKDNEPLASETNRRVMPTQRKDNRARQYQSAPKAFSIIQPSIYYYRTQSSRPIASRILGKSTEGKRSSRLVLPAMNASAFLDPLKYCKLSSRLSQNRAGVSRSISGTDAARRLLRGKKDFIVAARSLKTQPALLEGHGVPPQLFQHCVDMADALLLQYSPDVVECTFHNYNYVNGKSKLPHILRIRSRDATNRCSQWPPESTRVRDWNHHLELYLTVMERMACHLGMVLQTKKIQAAKANEGKKELALMVEHGDDGDELTSSPFLFPNSNIPQWNVDILRGSYFDLHYDGPNGRSRVIPPMPIVEFMKESENTGHVLIRLQGESAANLEFGSQRSREPVTLVFDACFRSNGN